jgi:AmmeMemoRadiSam system protein A
MNELKLIKLVKEAIASEFSGKKIRIPEDKELNEKRGCFVTLHKNSELRGCIGFPYPTQSLGEAIFLAAKSAAFSDPRFPPLSEKEWPEVKVEISILGIPEKIEARPENIKIGRDGLMCEYEGLGGLLLPQVAVEHKFDSEQFLRALCEKAGLPLDAWKKQGFKLWKFKAKIIKEEAVTAEK